MTQRTRKGVARMTYPIDRRRFLQSSTTVGAGLLLTPRLFAEEQAGRPDDINVALIGVGAQGDTLMTTCLKMGENSGIRFRAVCDIYERMTLKRVERVLKKYGHEARPYVDYQELLAHLQGGSLRNKLNDLADAVQDALTLDIDPEITKIIASAGTIYFAGRNDGVAEELTLKTNEITRKKSDFLEGTYAVHGIEEVMDKNEVVIIIDPFESEEGKFQECLADGVGLTVVAVAPRETSFPTIQIPEGGIYKEYIELAAGWNLLVEIGIALGIDLDKPVRARKVGNEYIL